MIGSTPNQLRKWDSTGELMPARRTRGGTRYYSVAELLGLSDKDSPTVAYARVSSQDQKADLNRQKAILEAYCAANGWQFEIVSDLGSGMNYRKKGLQQVLEMILRRRIQRLVLTHKERLLRFGADLVLALCEHQGVEVVIINQGERPSFEQELVRDVIEIITVFSARLYGARSHKTKRMLDAVKAETREFIVP